MEVTATLSDDESTVLFGSVQQGQVQAGDELDLVGMGERFRVTVILLGTQGRVLEIAGPGDELFVQVQGLKKDQAQMGMVLETPPEKRKGPALPNDVPKLIALLQGPGGRLSSGAAKALGEMGDGRAVRPLLVARRKGSRGMREAAVEALDRIGARTLEPFIAALTDQYPDVRIEAAHALGRIGNARAAESLGTALQDKDRYMRLAAFGALEKLDWQPDAGDLRAIYWWSRKRQAAKCAAIGRPAVEPLLKLLQDKGFSHRAIVAEALGRIGDARAVQPLLSALEEQQRFLRQCAARALVQMYSSGKLDADHKQATLARRDAIVQPHEDGHRHSDEGSCAENHRDSRTNLDTGIGVDFPL
jgi:hypothetical protein